MPEPAVRLLICLSALPLLASCDIEHPQACMAGNESGTVQSIQRIPYADTCHEMGCKTLAQPDQDDIVIRFRMANGSTRVCRGQWYPEIDTVKEGDRITITRLDRGSL